MEEAAVEQYEKKIKDTKFTYFKIAAASCFTLGIVYFGYKALKK